MTHPHMASQQFPAGIRVLVVDNDTTVLQVVEQMCSQCHYHVTTCSEALVALNLLRERKGCFDVILIEVHMPDMDGYDFLKHVIQEMNLLVIMMSVDATRSAVGKAIKRGACDYWIKPLRRQQFVTMWQHVARKALRENKQHEILGILEAEDQKKRGRDDSEFAASTVIAPKESGASKEAQACVVETDYNARPTKKPRVVWSPDLHRVFVTAIGQLGVDKAVPKKILEAMKVPGLTREHVASHLPKFRLFRKKEGSTGETQQPNGLPKAVRGTVNPKVGESGGSFDFQALAATTGHFPPETLAGLQTEVIGCPGSNFMPKEDHSALLKSSIPCPNPSFQAENTMMAYGNTRVSNIAKNVPHLSNMIIDDASSSRYAAWPPYNTVDSVGVNNSIPQMLLMKNNGLVNTLQLQEPQQQSLMHVQINSINVQPPCFVVSGAPEGSSPASVNQNFGFGWNSLNSPQSNNPFSVAQFPCENSSKAGSAFYGYTPPITQHQQLPNSTLTAGATLHQASFQSLLEYDGIKDTCISSRSAGLEMESSVSDFSRGKVSADIDNIITTKEEPNSINLPEEDYPFL